MNGQFKQPSGKQRPSVNRCSEKESHRAASVDRASMDRGSGPHCKIQMKLREALDTFRQHLHTAHEPTLSRDGKMTSYGLWMVPSGRNFSNSTQNPAHPQSHPTSCTSGIAFSPHISPLLCLHPPDTLNPLKEEVYPPLSLK